MSWYYAGPEAKPIGPISLEELQAARSSGAVGPETYVIEHTGQPGVVGAWRHYREVFPDRIPPLPPVPGALPAAPPVYVQPAAPTPHPLFPSAAHAPVPAAQPAVPAYAAAPHAHYPVYRTNAWCAWGLGLGIAGFIFSFACVGILLAAPALVLCILGFAQVQRRPGETGKGLAIAGAVLSILGLLISLGLLAWAVPLAIKDRDALFQQSSE